MNNNFEKELNENNEKISIFLKIYLFIFKKNKLVKQIFVWYIFISLIGSFFLWAPFTQLIGIKPVSYLDALFVSSSAFSDTGLTTLSISETYNWFGKFIISILIILGGLGFFTTKVFFINYVFNKKLTYEQKEQASQEISTGTINKSLEVIKVAIFSMIFSIFFFGLLFGILFATLPNSELKGNWLDSIFTGIFHSISSINNAGFDIFQDDVSMGNFYDYKIIQLLTIFLFVFGGVGFPVIYDVKEYLKSKSKGTKFKFSLFTKIASLTYFIIFFSGIFLSLTIEGISFAVDPENSFYGNPNYGSDWDKTWAIIFNTSSTRNAGYSTINLNDLSDFTNILYILMMFIGSGPGSTAGGLRTTTLFIIILYIFQVLIMRKKHVEIFNRTIDDAIVKDAIYILFFSIFIVILISVSVWVDEYFIVGEKSFTYLDSLFLSSSSYGTTGLSTVDLKSENVKWFNELMIILTMFIGQFGIFNLINLFKVHKKNTKIKNDYTMDTRKLLIEQISLS